MHINKMGMQKHVDDTKQSDHANADAGAMQTFAFLTNVRDYIIKKSKEKMSEAKLSFEIFSSSCLPSVCVGENKM